MIWANGYTELKIAELLGIHIETWNQVSMGNLRPSNKFQVALSQYLGDEVFQLFLGYYIDNRLEKIVPASEYNPTRVGKMMKEKILKALKEGKELRYD